MGLTKQYLRFNTLGIFGVIAAKNCNAVYLQPSRFVATGGTNVVTLWDTRFQRKVRQLQCDSAAVVLKPNEDASLLAVGHQNGALSVFDVKDKSDEASPDANVTFEGHTSEITCISWDDSGTIIATGGKDTRIIVWDCVSETGIVKLIGHRGPITQVRFWKDSTYLVSSSTDATIRIWDMVTHQCVHTIACNTQVWNFDTWFDCIIAAESDLRLFLLKEDPPNSSEWQTEELGTILRQANDRASIVKVVGNRHLLISGTKSADVEVFLLSSADEAAKKRRKRLKKNPQGEEKVILRDLIRRREPIKATEGKIKSLDAVIEKESTIQILCCLPSNQLETLTLPVADPASTSEIPERKPELMGFDGHRKLVRGIAFSADKTAILTASADCFKVWNRSTRTCILTIPHEYPVVCCKFCPGDRHFVAGTTCGNIILGDISLGVITQVESGGSENVWGVDVYTNNMGFAASNGNFVQFYDFSMSDGKLRFDLKRQLDVQDSVLSIKISPDMKFVAVGLLDSTIKMFYLDTLKFHLSMYGHSLPIVSIDISSDSTLLASCSGDKSVRVWGMDFGDCHCTMMHTDGLVGCSFFEKTHHVVSVAKNSINIYDADIHQRIQTLKAHVDGGSTCMSTGGFYIASAGRDQTIRLFHRTQEILVLDDEREQEREEDLEKDATEENPDLPSLKTAESEKSTDKLIEALDIFKDKSDSNPLIIAYGAKSHQDFMLKILTRIKSSELEQSLMLLPVAYVHAMIPALETILTHYPLATELCIRCLHGLMRFHLATFSAADKNGLMKVGNLAEKRLKDLRDTVGFNLAGLRFLNDRRLEKDEAEIFKELLGERKRKRKNREKALKRALLKV